MQDDERDNAQLPGLGEYTERPTPTWLPAVATRGAPLSRGARVAVIAALTVGLVALVLSALLTITLWRIGRSAAGMLDETTLQLEAVCEPDAAPVMFTFSQTIRFQGNVALPEGLIMPFKGTIPINTIVRLSVPGLPGAPQIEAPINTTVPVDTEVPIPGGITIPIDTEVPVHQEIPVDLCNSSSGLAEFLRRTAADLRAIRQQLPFRG